MFRLTLLLIFIFSFAPQESLAFYTLDTFDLAGAHSAPVSFASDGNGGFFGTTESDDYFTQTPVANNLNLKLHKFVIGDAFFYISAQGAFKAPSDLVALSITLSAT